MIEVHHILPFAPEEIGEAKIVCQNQVSISRDADNRGIHQAKPGKFRHVGNG